jgi:hypothetical protein
MHLLRLIAACLICAVLAVPSRAQTAGSSDSSEYLIKAGFTYNFAKLMQWPASTFPQPDSPIVIGILGSDPFGATLDSVLAGKKVNNRSFVVKHLKWGSADIKGCNILYVSTSEAARLDEIFHLLKGQPVLTIGQMPDFARRGGIINFIIEDDKVRFEVNVEAARQADISISSRLLTLAKIVPQTAADGSKTP